MIPILMSILSSSNSETASCDLALPVETGSEQLTAMLPSGP